MAWPSGETRVCKISIDHSSVAGSLSNFPALLTAADLPDELLEGTYGRSDGGDIRFATDLAGNNPIHFEVVAGTFAQNANPSLATAEIWVGIPTADTGSNGDVYIAYGNPSLTAPAANDATFGSQGVWANYLGVWHFATVSGSPSMADSTANNVSWTNNNGATAAAGQIDGAVEFDGSSQYLSQTALNLTSGYDWSLWIQSPTAAGGSGANWVMSAASSASVGFCWNHPQSTFSQAIYQQDSSGNYYPAKITSSLSTNTEYLVSGTWDGSTLTVWLNGSSEATASVSSITAATGIATLAAVPGPANLLGCIIDELRFSAVPLSANWKATEYNNQSNPAAFWTVGTPQNIGDTTASFSAAGTATSAMHGASTFAGHFAATGTATSAMTGASTAAASFAAEGVATSNVRSPSTNDFGTGLFAYV